MNPRKGNTYYLFCRYKVLVQLGEREKIKKLDSIRKKS